MSDSGREDQNPWTKWFWADYVADMGILACSLAAQGLWMRMLSVMARSKNKGFLLDGEKQMDNETLAKIAGSTEKEITPLIKELGEHNVYSIDESGLIYCRRMVREAELSRIRSEAGKLGGYPKHKRSYNKAIAKRYQNDSKAIPKAVARSASASASASASDISSLPRNKNQENIKGGCNPEDKRLVQLLIDLMLENNPNSSIIKHLTEKRQAKWLKTCRLLRETDGKAPEEIEAIIRFSQADDFWKPNILSMPKLREKWDQLWMKANRQIDKFAGIKEWLQEGEKK